ncbi:MAG: hypothetical protein M5U28_13695 [Sandaracinaceae bacterium]|nr:hypothetical protein [Sandaracinaceae bacterium]
MRAAPTPPDFGDCAPWAGGGSEPCEPWPDGHQSCTGAREHFPGEAACRAIGASCPAAGEWAADLPASGTILYVRAGATGGTGTRASPFGTLAAALAEAALRAPPVVVALAQGSYAGDITLAPGVTLWGACTEGTRVDAASAAVNVRAAPASALRNLRLSGGVTSVESPASAQLTLDRVLIEGASVGVSVAGGTLDASDLVVRGMTGGAARGVVVTAGGRASLRRAVLRDVGGSEGVGLVATGAGAVAEVEDVAILDTSDGGAAAYSGARLDAVRLVLERNQWAMWSADSTLEGHHVVARDARVHGLQALSSATTLTSSLVERVLAWGLSLNGSATVRDVVVRDVARYDPFDFDGTGIATWRSAVLLERVRVERTDGIGVGAWEGGDVTARSLDVRDTGLDARRPLIGAGVHVTDAARLSLAASRVRGARVAGVLAGACLLGRCAAPPEPGRWGSGTVATLTDVEIADTRPSFDDALPGNGLFATGGARIDATRVAVSGSAGAACAAGPIADPPISDAGSVTLTDALLRGPDGVAAYAGGAVTGSRVVVAGAEGAGIDANGAAVSLEDAVVADAESGVVSRDGGEVLPRGRVRPARERRLRARGGSHALAHGRAALGLRPRARRDERRDRRAPPSRHRGSRGDGDRVRGRGHLGGSRRRGDRRRRGRRRGDPGSAGRGPVGDRARRRGGPPGGPPAHRQRHRAERRGRLARVRRRRGRLRAPLRALGCLGHPLARAALGRPRARRGRRRPDERRLAARRARGPHRPRRLRRRALRRRARRLRLRHAHRDGLRRRRVGRSGRAAVRARGRARAHHGPRRARHGRPRSPRHGLRPRHPARGDLRRMRDRHLALARRGADLPAP